LRDSGAQDDVEKEMFHDTSFVGAGTMVLGGRSSMLFRMKETYSRVRGLIGETTGISGEKE